jgi:succinyl-diaminopimelate desuccinylase
MTTTTHAALRQQVLDWIEADREALIAFLSTFVAAASPNPPGDTTVAVKHLTDFLDREKLPYRIVDPEPTMANIVGSFEGGAGPGRHLVLNGHIDCFPVDPEDKRWVQPPWSGAVADGKVWGRGAADMKCGTTASVMTYRYLHRIREQLKGKLTLTCVSDEETFGPWGARWLIENEPEVLGDVCLNGEPSSPYTIRFGEKGPLWLAIDVQTRGAHGAYPHQTDSASKIAAAIVGELEKVTEIEPAMPDNVFRALEQAREAMEMAMEKGAADIVPKVTLNIGTIKGGLKVNMVPDNVRMEVDIRVPVGVTKEQVLAVVDGIMEGYPQARYEVMNYTPASWCEPYHEMVEILQKNAKESGGYDPVPIVSLGGTDARLWRHKNIPAYVYGPPPTGMGTANEHVEIETFLHIVRTHALSALDYMVKAAE